MNLLEVKNIKKSFDDLEVLKDISMSVAESEVISILGPSGSGKSTFLRCMTMLEKIDGGSMEYCGKEAVNSDSGVPVYADRAMLKEIQSYYGLVFQNFNLFPHYSVLKNIADALDHCLIVEIGSLKRRTLDVLEEEHFKVVEVMFRPTAENFAKFFYEEMKGKGYHVLKATVHETPNNCAAYME